MEQFVRKMFPRVLGLSLALLMVSCGGSDEDFATSGFAISQDTLQIRTRVEIPGLPQGVAIDNDAFTFKKHIFVADSETGDITAFDPDGVGTTIVSGIFGSTHSIIFTLLPNIMIVGESQSNDISLVDFNVFPASVTRLATLPQGTSVQDLTTDGTHYYAAVRDSRGADSIYNISTVSPIKVAEGITGAVGDITYRMYKGKKQLLFTDTLEGTISILEIDDAVSEDNVTDRFSQFAKDLLAPTGIAIGIASNFVYVCDGDALIRFTTDGKKRESVASILGCNDLVFDNDGTLFVSSAKEGKIFEITGTGEVVN